MGWVAAAAEGSSGNSEREREGFGTYFRVYRSRIVSHSAARAASVSCTAATLSSRYAVILAWGWGKRGER